MAILRAACNGASIPVAGRIQLRAAARKLSFPSSINSSSSRISQCLVWNSKPQRGFRAVKALEQTVQHPKDQRSSSTSDYKVREEGEPKSLSYRAFVVGSESGKTISPWHDIPLKGEVDGGETIFNFVVEIPKETSAKMEVATEEPFTPIKQDTKKGKLRFYPYNIRWNYGLLPQTWEDPNHSNPDVEDAFGDNDPVDVVEIGERTYKTGDVLRVKPVAVLAMIDEGELDWKVVAISVDDPKAELVNDEKDVEEHFPGTLREIQQWFRDYKVPDGKPKNRFGLGDEAAGKEYALKVIEETHQAWVKLVTRSAPAGDLSLL